MMERWNDGTLGKMVKNGIMKYWNIGILGKRILKVLRLSHHSIIPSFHYSIISVFEIRDGMTMFTGIVEDKGKVMQIGAPGSGKEADPRISHRFDRDATG